MKNKKIDEQTFNQFAEEIEMLIAECRTANNYNQEIYQDDNFNYKCVTLMNRYISKIKDKVWFKDMLCNWVTMMENSNEVEEYIINGLDGALGALTFYMQTGIYLLCPPY